MTGTVFQRETLPLGEILKSIWIFADEQEVIDLLEKLAMDIKMNDETDEF